MAAVATTAAPATSPDNNVAATQAANASYLAANPNALGTGSPNAGTSSTQPNFNSVSSENLQPSTPVSLPIPTPPNTTQANGLVAAGQQTSNSVQDYINALTPTQPTAVDQEQNTLLGQIASLTSEDTGKDQALLDAQQASGATADQASLTSLNNQLLTQTAQYNNEQANLGGNGSVETSAVLAAQNAGLTKARAADIGLTTAQIQAMQGNLTLAMNTAQEAVNAKYDTIEDNIKTSQAQLAAIQPMLDEEQKTQATAQAAYLQEQQEAVADQKDAETQINNVALQAASAGATPDVIAAISSAPDVISAIAAATPALGAAAAAKAQQQAFADNIQLQQLYISQGNLSLAQQKQAEEDNLTPANLISYAQEYAATGTAPAGAPTGSLGAISQIAGALPKAPGTIYDASTGVASPKISAETETSVSQLYNIINNILPQLSGNYTPATNSTGQQMISSVDDYNNTYSDLTTALTSLSTAGILKGSAATLISQIPDASHWYSSGIYTTQGKNQINNLTQTLTDSLNSYLSANNLAIAGFSDTDSASPADSTSNLAKFLTSP
jgi:hypothetical protein